MASSSTPRPRVFKTYGTRDLAKDTDLAFWLLRWLDQHPHPWQAARITAREIADACQIAEAAAALDFNHYREKLTVPALNWLESLSSSERLDSDSPLRIYPSRLKTLAMLRAFNNNPSLRADLDRLGKKYDRESGKVVGAVPPQEMTPELVTRIWADTLLYLQEQGFDISPWQDSLCIALDVLFADLVLWVSPPEKQTPREDREGARNASYALDLLVRAKYPALVNDETLKRSAIERLTQSLLFQRTRRKPELIEIYCGLQLCAHGGSDNTTRDAVLTLIRSVRDGYLKGDYKALPSQDASMLRLIAAYHGNPLTLAIESRLWDEMDQGETEDHARQEKQRDTAFVHLVRNHFDIELGRREVLAVGHSGNAVYRQYLNYNFGVRSTDATRRDRPLTADRLNIVIKQGDLPSLLHAAASYQKFREDIKPYFAPHTSDPQSVTGSAADPWYLLIYDLDGYSTLRQLLEPFDLAFLTRRQEDDIGRLTEDVGQGLRAVHSDSKRTQPKIHDVDNYYLRPLQQQLGELSAGGFPTMRRLVNDRLWVNDRTQPFKQLGAYVSGLRAHLNKLRPHTLGLVHGDCHSRNIMLNGSGQFKFVDLEHVHWDGDYILDYTLLLEDIALYRHLPESEEITALTPGSETESARNPKDYPTIIYPSITPRPVASVFQEQLLMRLEEFAVQIGDTYWQPRLWLATARALTLLSARRFISPSQSPRSSDEWGRVAMLYAETIRLLDELLNHLNGSDLPRVPFR